VIDGLYIVVPERSDVESKFDFQGSGSRKATSRS
jgi:hypothetical protein